MKRKIIKTVLSVALIVALLTAPMSALAAGRTAYLLRVGVSDAPSTYVRSESGEKLGSLKNGTHVLYWGQKKGQMLRVMTWDGKVGYVYQGNLKNYGAMNTKQLYLTSKKATIYRRSGGSLKKAATVGKGFPVIVYALRGDWAYVRNLNGGSAYMKTSALKKLAG